MQWLRPTSSPRPSGATSVLNAIRMVNKDKGPTLCIKPCNNYVKDRWLCSEWRRRNRRGLVKFQLGMTAFLCNERCEFF
ncbi:uncharacterized protein LOC119159936 isoform X1 [Rhipicephalus microplus]|uniref:uncharacterized protein LOC119159936 isoform X1 n=1 Tax=Rhipicephalus microplus TaxID=6941 RepID=UPI003F6CDA40